RHARRRQGPRRMGPQSPHPDARGGGARRRHHGRRAGVGARERPGAPLTMYITGWTVALSALGAVPALWVQDRAFAWVWVLGVIAVACLDAALAPKPGSLGVRRSAPRAVRLTESTAVELE